MESTHFNSFTGLVDLASEKNGGKALSASDEFFAAKENMLKEGRGIFIPGKFTENGKWMDGWESRRKRTAGNDWCIIELGAPGIIKGIDIDTNYFLGNHPPYSSVDSYNAAGKQPIKNFDKIKWTNLLPNSAISPGCQNLFSISNSKIWTHVRLNIFPDGGIARFRVYGIVKKALARNKLIDLAALMNGGKVIAANDMFFGSMDNLISPSRSSNMGDGWETRRKRIPGHDWAALRLAAKGEIRKIIVDTNFFKGNFPESCSIEGVLRSNLSNDAVSDSSLPWKEILPRTKLEGHKENVFEKELKDVGPVTHVRLNIFPDGGVSRLRLFGFVK